MACKVILASNALSLSVHGTEGPFTVSAGAEKVDSGEGKQGVCKPVPILAWPPKQGLSSKEGPFPMTMLFFGDMGPKPPRYGAMPYRRAAVGHCGTAKWSLCLSTT